MADIYYREIFRLHGLPLRFLSDRGPQFASKAMRTLLQRLGIKSDLTTAYHPQSNGQTVMNRTNIYIILLFFYLYIPAPIYKTRSHNIM